MTTRPSYRRLAAGRLGILGGVATRSQLPVVVRCAAPPLPRAPTSQAASAVKILKAFPTSTHRGGAQETLSFKFEEQVSLTLNSTSGGG